MLNPLPAAENCGGRSLQSGTTRYCGGVFSGCGPAKCTETAFFGRKAVKKRRISPNEKMGLDISPIMAL